MAKYTVDGYISIPVRLSVESKSARDAAGTAAAELDELAANAYKLLKDKASVLAHPLLDSVSGEVTAVKLAE